MNFDSPTEARIILRNLKDWNEGSRDAAQVRNLLRIAGIYLPECEGLAYGNRAILLVDHKDSPLKRQLLGLRMRELGERSGVLIYNRRPYALDMDPKTTEAGIPLVAIIHAEHATRQASADADRERLCLTAFPSYRATYRRELLADMERVAFVRVQYSSARAAARQIMEQYIKPLRYTRSRK